MAKNSMAPADGNGADGMEIQTINPVEKFLSRLGAMASVETNDTVSGDAIVGILKATTEAEVWEADERAQVNGQTLEDCEIGITSFEVRWGAVRDDMKTMYVDPASGKPMYLLVTSVRLSNAGAKQGVILPEVGEEFVWNTSATYIVAKIVKFGQMGLIDDTNGKMLECVVKGTPTANGSVLKLKPMPKRVVRG